MRQLHKSIFMLLMSRHFLSASVCGVLKGGTRIISARGRSRSRQIGLICTRSSGYAARAAPAHHRGSGASAPRLPVTFRDATWPPPGSTRDRRLLVSRMLLRVPDGCGADHLFGGGIAGETASASTGGRDSSFTSAGDE